MTICYICLYKYLFRQSSVRIKHITMPDTIHGQLLLFDSVILQVYQRLINKLFISHIVLASRQGLGLFTI